MSWDLLLFSLVIKSLWLFAVRIYVSRWWAVAGIQMDLFPKNFLISWSFLWNSSSFTHWILFKIRFYFFKRNLFIWLCWVLVVARGIFSCGLQTLSCLRWDLVPWPGSEPRPPALGAQSLTTGRGDFWNSHSYFVSWPRTQHWKQQAICQTSKEKYIGVSLARIQHYVGK